MLEEEKKEQKNMLIAMALVVVVLMVFNRFTAKSVEKKIENPVNVAETVLDTTMVQIEKSVPTVAEVVKGKELNLSNDFIDGVMSISSADQTGIVALNLKQYRETTDPNSPVISLLNQDYRAELNWKGLGLLGNPKIQGTELTPQKPVILQWENEFVKFERIISLDKQYLITFTDKILNKSDKELQAFMVGKIARDETTTPTNRSTVHEGFLGLFNNNEKEERYYAITEEKPFVIENKGGWIGQTDKYWQTIFIPDQNVTSTMKFEKNGKNYRSSFETPIVIESGKEQIQTVRLFAGAKELSVINDYAEQGIPRFDLSIDFGWYYFLTKPFLYILGWLYSLVGNMGIVILIFATLIRIALLPIATKSYESMAKMKKIQPKIKALQERFKDNRQQLQIEMMNLYKRDKVNPASGCLPMLIQIPVFFALYKVLSVSILMRQAPFFGWITDLSQPDPASVLTLFGLIPWNIPSFLSFLNIGVWPLLMGLTMVIQQRLNPQTTTNEDQKVIMNLMPVIFTFMMGNFASGLVIYWTWSNILSIAQQRYIMKKVGA